MHPLGQGGIGEVWKAVSAGGVEVALKIIYRVDPQTGGKELRALELVKNVHHPHLTPIVAFWMKDSQGNLLDHVAKPPREPAGDSHRDAPHLVDLEANDEFPLTDDEGGADDASGPKGSAAGEERSRESALFGTGPRQAVQLLIAMGLGDCNLLDRMHECQEQGLQGIPPEELLGYLGESAKAIDLLNQKHHVQHCDIKPQNILLVSGAAQVCDFGLAKSTLDYRVTANNSYTIAYGAPEILSTARPSPASDQFSLAISYFELRCGDLPFEDKTLTGIMTARTENRFQFDLLPPEERAVVERAAAREPTERYPSCSDFVTALGEAYRTRLAASSATEARPDQPPLDEGASHSADEPSGQLVDQPADLPASETAAKASAEPVIAAREPRQRIGAETRAARPDGTAAQPTPRSTTAAVRLPSRRRATPFLVLSALLILVAISLVPYGFSKGWFGGLVTVETDPVKVEPAHPTTGTAAVRSQTGGAKPADPAAIKSPAVGPAAGQTAMLHDVLERLEHPTASLAADLEFLGNRCRDLLAEGSPDPRLKACLAECLLQPGAADAGPSIALLDETPAAFQKEPYAAYVRGQADRVAARLVAAGDATTRAFAAPPQGPLTSPGRQQAAVEVLLQAAEALQQAPLNQILVPAYTAAGARQATEWLAFDGDRLPLTAVQHRRADSLRVLAWSALDPPDLEKIVATAPSLPLAEIPVQVAWAAAQAYSAQAAENSSAVTSYGQLLRRISAVGPEGKSQRLRLIDPALAAAARFVKSKAAEPLSDDLRLALAIIYQTQAEQLLCDELHPADGAEEAAAQTAFASSAKYAPTVENVAGQCLAIEQRSDLSPAVRLALLENLARQAAELDRNSPHAKLAQAWADLYAAQEGPRDRSEQMRLLSQSIELSAAAVVPLAGSAMSGIDTLYVTAGLESAAEAERLLAFYDASQRQEHLFKGLDLAGQALEKSPADHRFTALLTVAHLLESVADGAEPKAAPEAYAAAQDAYRNALAAAKAAPDETQESVALADWGRCRLRQTAGGYVPLDEQAAFEKETIEHLQAAVEKSPPSLQAESRSRLSQAIQYAGKNLEGEAQAAMYAAADEQAALAIEDALRQKSPDWSRYQVHRAQLQLQLERFAEATELAQAIVTAVREGDKSVAAHELFSAVEVLILAKEEPMERAAVIASHLDLFPPQESRMILYSLGLSLLRGETLLKTKDPEQYAQAMLDAELVLKLVAAMQEFPEARDDLQFRALALKANLLVRKYQSVAADLAPAAAEAASEAMLTAIRASEHRDPNDSRSRQLRLQLAYLHSAMLAEEEISPQDVRRLASQAYAAIAPLREDALSAGEPRESFRRLKQKLQGLSDL
ncbi:protein kinase domain-containing protein [Lignipirellula cremea]|uniref:protein kinase domain-containing protein n=1 Tax=Lignipirellula cremea TaxID=2528010 RepID=UPI0018D23241|nr:protein kinase [Lignipirellula cremea]